MACGRQPAAVHRAERRGRQPLQGLGTIEHGNRTENATKIIAVFTRNSAPQGLFGTQTGRIDMLIPGPQALTLHSQVAKGSDAVLQSSKYIIARPEQILF